MLHKYSISVTETDLIPETREDVYGLNDNRRETRTV